VEAVAKGDIDVAIAWGPLAGYFARKQPVALSVIPVKTQTDTPYLPLAYSISMGVKRRNEQLKSELDGVIDKRGAEIRQILQRFHVPQLPLEKR
jgi:mxaJ protein